MIQPAQLERIEPEYGSSFTVRSFDGDRPNSKPTWHFHPEIEIAFIDRGSGKRHIGNHMSAFRDGNLILMGPNLPHLGFNYGITDKLKEVVVQFRHDFMGNDFFNHIELEPISQLIERSKYGLSFYGDTKRDVGQLLISLDYMNAVDRLLTLIRILDTMAHSTEVEVLNAEGYSIEIQKQDNDRFKTIYSYIRQHFQEEISLETISQEAMMTIPAFCRYFKKTTHKTFTQFVNEFRIVHASKLLSEEMMSISEIAFESGFNNFSHFNRQFKRITGKSPRQFRQELRDFV